MNLCVGTPFVDGDPPPVPGRSKNTVTDRKQTTDARLLTPEDIAHWRSELESFFSGTLRELEGLARQIETRATAGPTVADVKPAVPLTEAAGSPVRTPERPAAESRTTSAPAPKGEPINSQDRLAELARQLEERLQRYDGPDTDPGT